MTLEDFDRLKMEDVPLRDRVQAIFHGTSALHDLSNRTLIPVVKALLSRTDKEEAIVGTFYRMYLWLESLVQLRRPIHIQAACAAARGMFELMTDIKLLSSDPNAYEKFHAFTFVRRYRVAKQLIDQNDGSPGADLSASPIERTFVNDTGNAAKYYTLCRTHWGPMAGEHPFVRIIGTIAMLSIVLRT